MTSIDRRMLLTRGAIGSAALTLTGGAALGWEMGVWGTSRKYHASPKKAAYRKVWAAVKRQPRWRVTGIWQNPLNLVWHDASVRLKSEGGEAHIPTVGQDGEGG
jgi:hypothetical protein